MGQNASKTMESGGFVFNGKGLKLDKDPVIAGHVRDAGVRRPGIPRIQRRLPPERDVRHRIRTVQPTVQYCTGDTF